MFSRSSPWDTALWLQSDNCTNARVALTNKRAHENLVILKVKICVELDTRWIYLIYNNAETTEYVEFPWKLLLDRYNGAGGRVKWNRRFTKYRIGRIKAKRLVDIVSF